MVKTRNRGGGFLKSVGTTLIIDSSHRPGKFVRAYRASSILLAFLLSISSFGVLIDGRNLLLLPIFMVLAALPFIPIWRQGGIDSHLFSATWTSRGFAAGFLVLQVFLFVEFTKTHGEGPHGQGAPGAFIIGMVFFAICYLCPWLVTALRSFGFDPELPRAELEEIPSEDRLEHRENSPDIDFPISREIKICDDPEDTALTCGEVGSSSAQP